MEQTDPSKDSEFFSLIVFQVEGCLFNVLRKPFVDESQVFRDMFELPTAEDTISDGTDEAHPLRLDGIKNDEFRVFLRAWYTPHHRPLELSEEEWLSVLKFAHMWAFARLREQAIKKLDSYNIDAIRKIQLARKYEIVEWVHKAFSVLVERKEGLTDEEGEQLGLRDALRAMRLREERLERVITHFKSGHSRTRRCPNGHEEKFGRLPASCHCSSWIFTEEIIDDGCGKFTFKIE